jgi:glycosyltransferase involved in cell wall biosynthesis
MEVVLESSRETPAGLDAGRRPLVLYIHHGQVPGGAPTSLRNLLEEIRRQSPELRLVVACAFEPMMPYFAEIAGVSVVKYVEAPVLSGKKLIGWSSFFDPRSLRVVLRQLYMARGTVGREVEWLERWRPDIVHLNSATLWTSAIATRRLGIPLVWHVRERLFGGPWSLRKIFYGAFLRKTADAVVAISPEDGASLGRDRENKVSIVYNPVDLRRFTPESYEPAAVRADFGLPHDAFIILSLGGFSPRKGSWQLVRALKRLPRRCHLVIAGDKLPEGRPPGALRRAGWSLENLAVRFGLSGTQSWRYSERVQSEAAEVSDRLYQIGHLGDVAPLVAACDVLVFGGTIPHFARPIYEAWAMKKPVIAFDTPVMRAEIAAGRDGLLVPRDSISRLVRALQSIADNPTLAEALGRNGWNKAMSRLDTGRSVQRIISIYRRLMGAQ